MGGSKKQTIGYHYKWLLHFGWCQGIVDALLELRGGDAPFWQGRMTGSGRISVNRPELWGGEKGEGGIVGDWDVMFGEQTQVPNDYLTGVLGAQQSAHRGKFTTVARGGRFGAFTPTPKSVSAKIERILTDWQGGSAWYPEKAVIDMDSFSLGFNQDGWKYRVEAPGSTADYSAADYDDIAWDVGKGGFGSGALETDASFGVGTYVPSGVAGRSIWIRRNTYARQGVDIAVDVYHDDGAWLWWNGQPISISTLTYYHGQAIIPGNLVQPSNVVALKVTDAVPTGTPTQIYAGLSLSQMGNVVNAMNPAHVLYESITRDDMQGEPVGLINDASFRAAADQLFSEGFGICTTWDSESETPEQFQQRICNLIAASLSQSRADGLYYLDLIRPVADPSTLPIITEDDVSSFKQTPWVGSEAINLMQVEWFDPQAKQVRTTQPVYSAAAIQDVGSPNSDSRTYHEIPVESLALRLAGRELAISATPLNKLDLKLLPRWRTLRAGTSARLQLPSEGIADMVIVIGEVGQGDPKDEKVSVIAAQNVFSFPDAVFVQPQPGGWVDPARPPTAPAQQLAFEAPYLELTAALSSGDLSALTADAGYIALLATRPTSGLNYEVDTAVASEAYQAYGIGDWAGGLFINEAAGPTDTSFTFTGGSDLERFAIGGWAVWGDEIVRIDALDTSAGTLSLGRGCADTVPAGDHAAGSVLLYAGEWVTGDQREYVGGDVVRAKLLTRTSSDKLDPSAATELSVTMADRQVRPYPPGQLRFDDASTTGRAYPASMVGAIVTRWAHRDRLLQADQVVDESAASIGPEAGTTYTVRYYQPPGMLIHTESSITGTAATAYTFPADGSASITVEAERDGHASWQAASHTFDYLVTPDRTRIAVGGDRRVVVGGDIRVSRG